MAHSSQNHLKVGDTYTIAGVYRRRTFWQWLTRQPRTLQVFHVTAIITSDAEVAYIGLKPAL